MRQNTRVGHSFVILLVQMLEFPYEIKGVRSVFFPCIQIPTNSKRPYGGVLSWWGLGFGEVFRNMLGHFKHVDYLFAGENLFEVIVGIDVSLVYLILKFVLLDVNPEFFDYFRPGHWTLTDNRRQISRNGHWLHERRICFLRHFLLGRLLNRNSVAGLFSYYDISLVHHYFLAIWEGLRLTSLIKI